MRVKERRTSPRTPTNVLMDLYDGKGRMIIGEGRFVNLSEQGGLMESEKPLQLHKPIRLQVQSVGKSPLELAAHVVWRRRSDSHFTYGIAFDDAATEKTFRKAS